ncbi:VOC family protein [Novosphingobium sp. Fuku2-ISO-50]|uniref:VOC family protein n=1 Tax=Novosphingobium sp. Fuku2-ISO-50 TaxID=1739114 RepID=UPI000A4C60C9|nr:VOC family protein [Novosphingobium sp. Fuku2-ISO-50]
MAQQIPSARALDTDFMFTKLNVHDLEAATAFYSSVTGLVEMTRVEAVIAGRPVTEVVYMPTYPGGPMFILAHFHDVTTPATGELIMGFASQDLDAFVARAEQAGGKVIEAAREIPGAGMRVAFVADTEGHVLQVTQIIG